jgi:hypothetical protein
MPDEQNTTDAAQVNELRTRLAAKREELREMLEAMPHHSVRVHQQLALEDAEDEVQALEAELAALEGGTA